MHKLINKNHLRDIATVIDTHVAGEPARIVLSGTSLNYDSGSASEIRDLLISKFDHTRQLCVKEPRGHSGMFGAFIFPSSKTMIDKEEKLKKFSDTHAKIVFFDTSGYLTMCGHGTIGAVTVMIEMALLKGVNSLLENSLLKKQSILLQLDVPAGKITALCTVINKQVTKVKVKNVPSYYLTSLKLPLQNQYNLTDNLPIHLAYGGNMFLIVELNELKKRNIINELSQKNIEKIISFSNYLKETFNHSINQKSLQAALVSIFDKISDTCSQNITTFGQNQIDRSPCGSGTSAKMAMLNHYHKLLPEHLYENISIIGTSFMGSYTINNTCKKIDIPIMGDNQNMTYKSVNRKTITPYIEGSAHIISHSRLVLSTDDPFTTGFVL